MLPVCFFAIHFVHTNNNLKLTWHGQSEILNWLFGKHELCFFFFNTNTKQVSGTTLIIQADWKVSKHQLSLKKNTQTNKNHTHFDKNQLGMRFFFPQKFQKEQQQKKHFEELTRKQIELSWPVVRAMLWLWRNNS